MKEIYLDTETLDLPENNKNDILCQLAYLVFDRENKKFTELVNDFYLPENYKNMSVKAMAMTYLTPEILEEKESNTKEGLYTLQTLVKDSDNILYIHNSKFDLEVLRRVGLVINCKVICILRVTNFINDREQLPYESTSLNYMHYYTKGYQKIKIVQEALKDKFKVQISNNSHDALFDVLSLFLYTQWLKANFDFSEEVAINITKNPFTMTYCSFGKNRGKKFSEMTQNQLKYYYELQDNDICYTIDNL